MSELFIVPVILQTSVTLPSSPLIKKLPDITAVFSFSPALVVFVTVGENTATPLHVTTQFWCKLLLRLCILSGITT